MRRVIVTGAAGFIGANLARRLLADGFEVHILVRPPCALWRLDDVLDDLTPHWVDIEDGEGVAATFAKVQPDCVFHLAAHGAYSWQQDLRQMIGTNLVGTVNLVEAASKTGFEVFVHTGSSSEYGRKDHPVAETEWLDPNSYYAVTKASSTLFCRFVAQRDGTPVRTIRPYSVYGPWEEPNRLMPTLVLAALEGRLPPLVDPATARDYVYVDDVVDAYMSVAATPGQEPGAVYNVGTGSQTSLREVVEVVRAEMGVAAEPEWGSMPARSWDTDVWVADTTRIRAALGWTPRRSLREGFRSLVDWMAGDERIRGLYEERTKRRP